MVDGSGFFVQVNQRQSYMRRLQRACVSYFDAQMSALGRKLEAGRLRRVVNVVTFDDCSHRMVPDGGGPEQATTVLATRQRLLVTFEDVGEDGNDDGSAPPVLRCCLHAPVAFLNKANAATMHPAMIRRMVVSASGVGSFWKLPQLQAAIDQGVPVALVYVCDAAAVNTALLTRELCARHENTVGLQVICLHHQAALVKRPLALSVDGVVSALVRLGHLLQAASTRFAILEAVRVLLRREFAFIPCDTLPNSTRLHRRKLAVLVHGFCGHDIAPETAVSLTTLVNGPLDSHTITHFCIPGCCTCRDEALAKVESALVASISAWPPVPLLYRWKGLDPAIAYMLRNTVMHRLLPRALEAAKSQPGRRQSKQGDEHSYGEVQTARASAVLKMLAADSAPSDLALVAFATQPLDHVMNTLFSGDSNKVSALMRTPVANEFMDMASKRLGQKARADSMCSRRAESHECATRRMTLHVPIRLRHCRAEAVEDFGRLLLLPADDLTVEALGLQGRKREAHSMLLVGLADTWRRMVFRYDDPNWLLFHICELDRDSGMALLDRLAARRTCESCLDAFFSRCLLEEWSRSQSFADKDRVFVYERLRCWLRDIAASAPASSYRVERDHAMDQRAIKGWHRSKGAANAAAMCFLARVNRSWQRERSALQRMRLNPKLVSAAAAGCKRAKRRSWTQATTLHQEFLRAQLKQSGGRRITAELHAAWRALTAAEKADYAAAASSSTAARVAAEQQARPPHPPMVSQRTFPQHMPFLTPAEVLLPSSCPLLLIFVSCQLARCLLGHA